MCDRQLYYHSRYIQDGVKLMISIKPQVYKKKFIDKNRFNSWKNKIHIYGCPKDFINPNSPTIEHPNPLLTISRVSNFYFMRLWSRPIYQHMKI